MDIVKIASETIEGLFNMRLALPVALVRALTEGLDEVLRKWVFTHCIASPCGTTTPQAACVTLCYVQSICTICSGGITPGTQHYLALQPSGSVMQV